MLTVNLGDVATRIVRAFRVRGRVPSQLDEVMVPTTLVMDLTDPLFAQNPQTWAGQIQSTPLAAVTATFGITNVTPGVTTIIDSIQLFSTEAAADTWNLTLFRKGGTVSTNRQSAYLNIDSPAPGILGQAIIAAYNGVGGGTGRQIYTLLTPGGQSNSGIIPLGVVLFPGDRLELQSVNVGVLVTAFINIFGRDFLAS